MSFSMFVKICWVAFTSTSASTGTSRIAQEGYNDIESHTLIKGYNLNAIHPTQEPGEASRARSLVAKSKLTLLETLPEDLRT
jgi:hypothetical protein